MTGTCSPVVIPDNKPARKILGLPGSLRQGSFNRLLLETAAEEAPSGVTVELFGDLASIPPFSEDAEASTRYGPPAVQRLRQAVQSADGLLIATPEYNQSIPGVLKNLIDWLSRPGPEEVLAGKPVAVIGASTGPWGTRLAQKELRHVLHATESLILPASPVFIRNAEGLFDEDGRLADPTTRARLTAVLQAFSRWIERVEEV